MIIVQVAMNDIPGNTGWSDIVDFMELKEAMELLVLLRRRSKLQVRIVQVLRS